jgi:Rieske 2Fe-2S family protein
MAPSRATAFESPPRLTRSSLEAVLASSDSARSLPRAAFVDPLGYRLDAACFFERAWLAAAHEGDVEVPGAWSRHMNPARRDLTVVRCADLELALVSSTCRHRGAPLVEGERGCAARLELVCPYHGWTYDLDGTLRRAPGLADGVDRDALGLHAGVVAKRGPIVFAATRTPEAAPTPVLPPWLERAELDVLRRVFTAMHVVAANWKLLVGNFQEAHHFPHVHPALEARTPFAASSSVTPDHGHWLGGVMELAPGLETVSGTGRREGRRWIAAPEDRGRVHDAWIAPNLLTSLQPDYLLTYRLEPEAPDRTRVVFAIDVHAGAPEAEIADGVADLVAFWSNVNAEDRAICEAQQRGLAAAPNDHEAGPRASSEDGLDAFERLVARAYLDVLGRDDA